MQLFKASLQGGLAGMRNVGFETEKQIQTLVENNIGALFPDIKFLKTEDRDITEGKRRPDTIAFDTKLNTFVVLEYKNKQDRGVIAQVKAYLQDMNESKGDLVLAYNEQSDYKSRSKNSFDWNKMYTIIIATEFDDHAIQGAKNDAAVEMYEIEMYDDSVVAMKRVGGTHMRKEPIHRDEPVTLHPPHTLKNLCETIRERMLDEFLGSEINTDPKHYDGFRYPGKSYFCTMSMRKSKILMWYYGKTSSIQNMKDFESALVNLNKLSAANRAGSGLKKRTKRQSMGNTSNRTWSGPLWSTPLSEIDFLKITEPPIQVSWNGVIHGGLNTWVDVLACVATLLVTSHASILKSKCPVMVSPKTAVMNINPINPNGTAFRASMKVGGVFLNKHGNKTTIIMHACKLAEAAGVDAKQFKVFFPKRNNTF